MFLIYPLLFCGQKTKKAEGSKTCKVKIRLIYEKKLVKKPIEIILADCNIKYSQKIIKDRMNYSFNDVHPGKYLIGLTFNEDINGNLTKETYGHAPWNLHSINIDSEGKVYSKNEVLRDSEIEVYPQSSVLIDLIFSVEYIGGTGQNVLTVEFKKEFFKIKNKEDLYYKIRIIRFLMKENVEKEVK